MTAASFQFRIRHLLVVTLLASIPLAIGAAIGWSQMIGFVLPIYLAAPTILAFSWRFFPNSGPFETTLGIQLAVILTIPFIVMVALVDVPSALSSVFTIAVMWSPQFLLYQAWKRGLESAGVRTDVLLRRKSRSAHDGSENDPG